MYIYICTVYYINFCVTVWCRHRQIEADRDRQTNANRQGQTAIARGEGINFSAALTFKLLNFNKQREFFSRGHSLVKPFNLRPPPQFPPPRFKDLSSDKNVPSFEQLNALYTRQTDRLSDLQIHADRKRVAKTYIYVWIAYIMNIILWDVCYNYIPHLLCYERTKHLRLF